MIQRRVNPDGSIRWVDRWREPDGKERSRTYATRGEAQEAAALRLLQKRTGTWADPRKGRTPLSLVWRDYEKTSLTHKAPKTQAGYRSAWNQHISQRFGSWPVADISSPAVADWVSETTSKRSASTTRQAFRVLSLLLDDAVRQHLIGFNPAKGVSLPRKSRREMRMVTVEEVESLAAKIGGIHGDFLRTAVWTGGRFGEIAGLRIGDVDLKARRIHIQRQATSRVSDNLTELPKGRKRRVVPLLPEAADVLAPYLKGPRTQFIFRTANGTHFTNSNFRKTADWYTHVDSLGLTGFRFHDARHTFVSTLISLGAPVPLISQAVGHASTEITLNTYTHLLPDAFDLLLGAADDRRSGDE